MTSQTTEPADSSQEVEDLMENVPRAGDVDTSADVTTPARRLRTRQSMPSLPVRAAPRVGTDAIAPAQAVPLQPTDSTVPAKRTAESSTAVVKKKPKRATDPDVDELGLSIPAGKKDGVIHGNIQTLARKIFATEDGLASLRADLAAAVERLTDVISAQRSPTNDAPSDALRADVAALSQRFDAFLPAHNKSVEAHNHLVAAIELELATPPTEVSDALKALTARLTTQEASLARLSTQLTLPPSAPPLQPHAAPPTTANVQPRTFVHHARVTAALGGGSCGTGASSYGAGPSSAVSHGAGPTSGISYGARPTFQPPIIPAAPEATRDVLFGPWRWYDRTAKRQFDGLLTGVWHPKLKGAVRGVTTAGTEPRFLRITWASTEMAELFLSIWAARDVDYCPGMVATLADQRAA